LGSSASSARSTRSWTRSRPGRGRFKAIRGDYGSGKTFFARWLEHRARERGFATTLVQISETETPLYKLQTLYRRAIENLQTQEWTDGAFASLIDRWLYSLEEEVIERGGINPDDPGRLGAAVGDLLERRLADVSKTQPQYAAALRRCYAARLAGDHATEQGLIAWLMGQPNVAASLKRDAGIKGDLDSDGASGFLRGLLEVLRQTGRKGLVLVLDEVETIQRVRGDSREKSLNALRALIDDVHAGRYPGLYVLITGTPAFFDGPQGVRRLAPLAQRLETDFSGDPRFHNPRAPQIWLQPFDHTRASSRSVVASATCTRRRRPRSSRRGSPTRWSTPWPEASPGSSASGSASRPACSCAGWSTCSTASRSSPTSSRRATTTWRSRPPR
jgi:hypothetical protein